MYYTDGSHSNEKSGVDIVSYVLGEFYTFFQVYAIRKAAEKYEERGNPHQAYSSA